MPIYAYVCPEGHGTERLRKYEDRDDETICHCGASATRTMARTHSPPSGVYSYLPNIGDPDRFERQRDAIKNGRKVIPRVPDMPREARDGQLTSSRRKRGG